MTIPDKLVTAAAEAMHRSECGCIGGQSCATWRVNHDHMAPALAAAFAALPECEAEVVKTTGGSTNPTSYAVGRVLAALARMAE